MKKQILCSTILAIVISSFSACNMTNKESMQEEIHNPAKVAIPEESKELIGRWDLTVMKDGRETPAWLEIKLSGFNTLVGSFVSDAGSARPISHIALDNGMFSFEIPTQWEDGTGLIRVEGELNGGDILGKLTSNKGNVFELTGVKAPYLVREGTGELGEPIVLFNGKNLDGWTVFGGDNNWSVKDGILVNEKAGANLKSNEVFDDFKLEAEFRYAESGNSGIYLRGRYEVQIEDSPLDRHPGPLYYAGVYGFLSPSAIVTNGANEWNSFEITLRGRMVTIIANGKTVISNQEIPGITGGALDSKEGEPGPIYLQGDHSGIEFRKLVITPIK